jgi:hypothetical protein
MDEDEVERIGGPDKIRERGRHIPFRLGTMREVNPTGWAEMSRVYFATCHSPELEKLRASYGLSPRYKNHRYHITVAVRRRAKRPVKRAQLDPRLRSALVGAGLGGAGGALIDLLRRDREEEEGAGRRQSFLRRNRSALMGLLMGGGLGGLYGAHKRGAPAGPPQAEGEEVVNTGDVVTTPVDDTTTQAGGVGDGPGEVVAPAEILPIAANMRERFRLARLTPSEILARTSDTGQPLTPEQATAYSNELKRSWDEMATSYRALPDNLRNRIQSGHRILRQVENVGAMGIPTDIMERYVAEHPEVVDMSRDEVGNVLTRLATAAKTGSNYEQAENFVANPQLYEPYPGAGSPWAMYSRMMGAPSEGLAPRSLVGPRALAGYGLWGAPTAARELIRGGTAATRLGRAARSLAGTAAGMPAGILGQYGVESALDKLYGAAGYTPEEMERTLLLPSTEPLRRLAGAAEGLPPSIRKLMWDPTGLRQGLAARGPQPLLKEVPISVPGVVKTVGGVGVGWPAGMELGRALVGTLRGGGTAAARQTLARLGGLARSRPLGNLGAAMYAAALAGPAAESVADITGRLAGTTREAERLAAMPIGRRLARTITSPGEATTLLAQMPALIQEQIRGPVAESYGRLGALVEPQLARARRRVMHEEMTPRQYRTLVQRYAGQLYPGATGEAPARIGPYFGPREAFEARQVRRMRELQRRG